MSCNITSVAVIRYLSTKPTLSNKVATRYIAKIANSTMKSYFDINVISKRYRERYMFNLTVDMEILCTQSFI